MTTTATSNYPPLIYPDLQNIMDKLDQFYKCDKIPHIIFHGSSGTGKQTIVQSFISKIYNADKQKIKNNVMNVNCAHGKGIKFIRDDLKFFAKTNIQSSCGVAFKSIVLYNADCLTIDAQSALRRCIEIFSSNTRFFIVVENKNKLLKPILSRFCEIYVPDTLDKDTGRICNLHTERIRQIYDFKSIEDTRMKVLQGILENSENTRTYASLSQLASTLYDRGYSAEDFILWVKNRFLLDNTSVVATAKPTDTILVYNKIKSEFRCEKLILFFLLDFFFLRSDKSLNNISFM